MTTAFVRLAGPRRRLTVMAAVTCVNAGDVSEHLLTRPGTEVIITGQITSWPKGWDEKDSATRTLWDAWNQERLTGLENLDGGKRARAFYKAQQSRAYRRHGGIMERTIPSIGRLAEGWRPRRALFAAMGLLLRAGRIGIHGRTPKQPLVEGVTINASIRKASSDPRVDKTRPPPASSLSGRKHHRIKRR